MASKLVLSVSCAIFASESCIERAMTLRIVACFSVHDSAASAGGTGAAADAAAGAAAGAAASAMPTRPPIAVPAVPAACSPAAGVAMRPSATSFSTSRSMTRPTGPEPCAWRRSAPVRSARCLARGDTAPEAAGTADAGAGGIDSVAAAASEAAGAAAGASAAAGAGAAAPSAPLGAKAAASSPGAPMTQTFVRQGTSSPSWKNAASSVPATEAVSSNVALSVS